MFQCEGETARRRELFSGGGAKQAAEHYLAAHFASHVGRLSLQDMVVMLEGRKLPRSLGEFSLLPLVSSSVPEEDSLVRPGTGFRLPEEIRTTYGPSRISRPYLDAGFGIGLVRQDWLVAVASAGINEEGNIQVVQLQDVSGVSGKNMRFVDDERYRTGLHDGFQWRDTLVACWIQVALETGIGDRVVVQAAQNNSWRSNSNKEALIRGYDQVAERMGFIQRDDKNWGVELYTGELVWPDFTSTELNPMQGRDATIAAIHKIIGTM